LEQLPVFSRAVAKQLFGLLFPPSLLGGATGMLPKLERFAASAGPGCASSTARTRLNLRGAFKVPDTQEIKVRDRNVLLIDDV
jgi:predicted amidophosphoribosyltransferase